jgi:hypothetical protein
LRSWKSPASVYSRAPIQSTRSRLQPSGMATAFLYSSVKVSQHVHYLGAGALSFGENIRLHDGDVVGISFGRPLRNTVHAALSAEYHPVRTHPLP